MNLISVKNVSFSYENIDVLNNISFDIEKNDYLCIVGENGSGKSTLIKGLLKLKKPKSGEIIFNNIKSSEIGYISQNDNIGQNFIASVYEIVLSGTLNKLNGRFFYSSKEKEVAKNNIKRLGIENIINKNFNSLSGGQKQRVLLARALCASSKLIILDEPNTGLDKNASVELYNIILDLNKEGISVVMVTHDIDSALKYSNKILHLDNDEVFFGTKQEYINSGMERYWKR